MNLERSAFLASSPMREFTNAASIVIVSPVRSEASNQISSSTRSMTVCRRRAPMFSTVELTRTAASAIASMASVLKSRVTPRSPVAPHTV